MTDVIELVENHHREIEDLFATFESTHDAAVAFQLCDELDHQGIRTTEPDTRGLETAMNATIIGNAQLVDVTSRVDAALTAIRGRHQLTGDEVTDLLLDLRSALRQAADLEALLAVAADARSGERVLAELAD